MELNKELKESIKLENRLKNALEFDSSDSYEDICEKKTICKSFEFLDLNSKLSLLEMRIIDLYLARINPSDGRFQIVKFTKRDFENVFNIKRVKTEDLKKALVNLEMMKIFKVYTRVEYNCIYIYLDIEEKWHYHAFALRQYFKYTLNDVRDLSRNDYALFQYFMSKKKMYDWKVKVDELKEKIGVEDKYHEFCDFEKLIKSTLKILKEKSGVLIKYTKIKKNHRIYYLHFEREWMKEKTQNENNKKSKKKKTTKQTKVNDNEKLKREEYTIVEIYNTDEYKDCEKCGLDAEVRHLDIIDQEYIIKEAIKCEKETNKKVIYHYLNKNYYIVVNADEYSEIKNQDIFRGDFARLDISKDDEDNDKEERKVFIEDYDMNKDKVETLEKDEYEIKEENVKYPWEDDEEKRELEDYEKMPNRYDDLEDDYDDEEFPNFSNSNSKEYDIF